MRPSSESLISKVARLRLSTCLPPASESKLRTVHVVLQARGPCFTRNMSRRLLRGRLTRGSALGGGPAFSRATCRSVTRLITMETLGT